MDLTLHYIGVFFDWLVYAKKKTDFSQFTQMYYKHEQKYTIIF